MGRPLQSGALSEKRDLGGWKMEFSYMEEPTLYTQWNFRGYFGTTKNVPIAWA